MQTLIDGLLNDHQFGENRNMSQFLTSRLNKVKIAMLQAKHENTFDIYVNNESFEIIIILIV